MARQIELHRRPFSQLTVDLGVASGLLNEPVYLGHSDTGINHSYHDILPWFYLLLSRNIYSTEVDIFRLDRQSTPRRHGVSSVDCQIYYCALQFIMIQQSLPESLAKYNLNVDRLP